MRRTSTLQDRRVHPDPIKYATAKDEDATQSNHALKPGRLPLISAETDDDEEIPAESLTLPSYEQLSSYEGDSAFKDTVGYGWLYVDMHFKDEVAEKNSDDPNQWLVVGIGIASLLAIMLSRQLEVSSRRDYLDWRRIQKTNKKLRNQLNQLQGHYAREGADFESPLEKAIALAKTLLADPDMDADTAEILTTMLDFLRSATVNTPDFINQDLDIDEDQQQWLFSELVPNQRRATIVDERDFQSPSLPRIFSITINDEVEEESPDYSPSLEAEHQDSFELPTIMAGSSKDVRQSADLGSQNSTAGDANRISTSLARVRRWEWDLFELADASVQRPLSVLANHLLRSAGLLESYKIPTTKWRTFVTVIEQGYQHNPYHNSMHATDVLHGVHWVLGLDTIATQMTSLELLAAYVAAIIHDYDHPGVNNNFLINSRHPKSVLYNDRSILENHHAASAFSVLAEPQNDFLENLSPADYKALRATAIDMVLATDLSHHFAILSSFKAKIAARNFDWRTVTEDRKLLLQLAIKMGDVSNPAKPWYLYSKWVDRIFEEFFNQGDKEKELGIPVSPFMDRTNCNFANCQLSFIDFIVSPLFDAFNTLIPIPTILDYMKQNRARWTQVKTLLSPTLAFKLSLGARVLFAEVDSGLLPYPTPEQIAPPNSKAPSVDLLVLSNTYGYIIAGCRNVACITLDGSVCIMDLDNGEIRQRVLTSVPFAKSTNRLLIGLASSLVLVDPHKDEVVQQVAFPQFLSGWIATNVLILEVDKPASVWSAVVQVETEADNGDQQVDIVVIEKSGTRATFNRFQSPTYREIHNGWAEKIFVAGLKNIGSHAYLLVLLSTKSYTSILLHKPLASPSCASPTWSLLPLAVDGAEISVPQHLPPSDKSFPPDSTPLGFAIDLTSTVPYPSPADSPETLYSPVPRVVTVTDEGSIWLYDVVDFSELSKGTWNVTMGNKVREIPNRTRYPSGPVPPSPPPVPTKSTSPVTPTEVARKRDVFGNAADKGTNFEKPGLFGNGERSGTEIGRSDLFHTAGGPKETNLSLGYAAGRDKSESTFGSSASTQAFKDKKGSLIAPLPSFTSSAPSTQTPSPGVFGTGFASAGGSLFGGPASFGGGGSLFGTTTPTEGAKAIENTGSFGRPLPGRGGLLGAGGSVPPGPTPKLPASPFGTPIQKGQLSGLPTKPSKLAVPIPQEPSSHLTVRQPAKSAASVLPQQRVSPPLMQRVAPPTEGSTRPGVQLAQRMGQLAPTRMITQEGAAVGLHQEMGRLSSDIVTPRQELPAGPQRRRPEITVIEPVKEVPIQSARTDVAKELARTFNKLCCDAASDLEELSLFAHSLQMRYPDVIQRADGIGKRVKDIAESVERSREEVEKLQGMQKEITSRWVEVVKSTERSKKLNEYLDAFDENRKKFDGLRHHMRPESMIARHYVVAGLPPDAEELRKSVREKMARLETRLAEMKHFIENMRDKVYNGARKASPPDLDVRVVLTSIQSITSRAAILLEQLNSISILVPRSASPPRPFKQPSGRYGISDLDELVLREPLNDELERHLTEAIAGEQVRQVLASLGQGQPQPRVNRYVSSTEDGRSAAQVRRRYLPPEAVRDEVECNSPILTEQLAPPPNFASNLETNVFASPPSTTSGAIFQSNSSEFRGTSGSPFDVAGPSSWREIPSTRPDGLQPFAGFKLFNPDAKTTTYPPTEIMPKVPEDDIESQTSNIDEDDEGEEGEEEVDEELEAGDAIEADDNDEGDPEEYEEEEGDQGDGDDEGDGDWEDAGDEEEEDQDQVAFEDEDGVLEVPVGMSSNPPSRPSDIPAFTLNFNFTPDILSSAMESAKSFSLPVAPEAQEEADEEEILQTHHPGSHKAQKFSPIAKKSGRARRFAEDSEDKSTQEAGELPVNVRLSDEAISALPEWAKASLKKHFAESDRSFAGESSMSPIPSTVPEGSADLAVPQTSLLTVGSTGVAPGLFMQSSKEKPPSEMEHGKTPPLATFNWGSSGFKPAAVAVGSWKCSTCGITNKPTDSQCPACENPKPLSSEAIKAPDNKGASAAVSSMNAVLPVATAVANPLGRFDWSAAGFKRQTAEQGEWKCPTCGISNKANASQCAACETVKPGMKQPIASSVATTVNSSEVKSGLVSQPSQPAGGFNWTAAGLKAPTSDPGSWKCPTCDISNKSSNTKCASCETDKPGSSTSVMVVETQQAKPLSFGPAGGTPFALNPAAFGFGSDSTKQLASDTQTVSHDTAKDKDKPVTGFAFSSNGISFAGKLVGQANSDTTNPNVEDTGTGVRKELFGVASTSISGGFVPTITGGGITFAGKVLGVDNFGDPPPSSQTTADTAVTGSTDTQTLAAEEPSVSQANTDTDPTTTRAQSSTEAQATPELTLTVATEPIGDATSSLAPEPSQPASFASAIQQTIATVHESAEDDMATEAPVSEVMENNGVVPAGSSGLGFGSLGLGAPISGSSVGGMTSMFGLDKHALTTPAFGQSSFTPSFDTSASQRTPSQPQFGQSSFGQPAFGTSTPFGAAVAGTRPVFGQGSFGASSAGFGVQPASSFGGETAASRSTGFGSLPAGGGGFAAFASNPVSFGSVSNQTSSTPTFGSTTSFGASTASSAFGSQQPSTFGGVGSSASAFGQSAFGQAQQASAAQGSSFGQSAFGQTQPSSAFGQTQPSSAFGQSAFGAGSAFGGSGFGSAGGGGSAGAGTFGSGAQPAFQSSAAFAPRGGFGQARGGARNDAGMDDDD
ncbi:High affinity cAMP-specific 3',5'-cyclic phosphodiesterase 7A [Gonapodya sp. JEL0774]|nr:High affinity cAMP-specific 3',5'-cyclic phosphodiesterase 7A [Gonapodya sp. JEL0774]